MRTFRNNNKRGRFRSNDRSYKRNGETSKFSSDYSSNSNFQRNLPSRNIHNAPKLIEKYNDLAREALSNGDKILSENYFQHADHFTRILAEKESLKLSREKDNKNTIEVVSDNTKLTSDETENQEKQILKT
jgi:hypothetical protein